ncbi:MAG: hypothetical protein K0B09_00865 [Bacteroidales bacterium]|nr:hypothetical protein [Bacteroidales bacterium]
MSSIETLRNRLIDRIMATRNKKFLEAIDKLFSSVQKEEILSLTSEQIEMLMMSEEDIKTGNIISEEELNEKDSEWMD